ncbi:hypothetical protein SDJN03_21494, partial [Cucurbita argyrosperma subsp. sororia]
MKQQRSSSPPSSNNKVKEEVVEEIEKQLETEEHHELSEGFQYRVPAMPSNTTNNNQSDDLFADLEELRHPLFNPLLHSTPQIRAMQRGRWVRRRPCILKLFNLFYHPSACFVLLSLFCCLCFAVFVLLSLVAFSFSFLIRCTWKTVFLRFLFCFYFDIYISLDFTLGLHHNMNH